MDRADLVRLARLGAESRLSELQGEIQAIYRSFPDLRKGTRSAAPSPVSSKRSRKKMSTAARRKIAQAQKKRWAEWRRKKGKTDAG